MPHFSFITVRKISYLYYENGKIINNVIFYNCWKSISNNKLNFLFSHLLKVDFNNTRFFFNFSINYLIICQFDFDVKRFISHLHM